MTDVRKLLLIPIAMFLSGIACTAAAVAIGDAEVQLVIVIPLISGTGWLFVLGVVLIMASFVLGFVLAASFMREEAEGSGVPPSLTGHPGEGVQRRESRYGGVILIGPVPIVFGSDKNIALIMLAIAVAVAAIVLAYALLSL